MHMDGLTGSWGTQKRELNPIELELQMFVSHHMNAKNQTYTLSKNALNHLPSP